ncbi:MAG: 3-hydroxyacyl-CoA dehydrogenase/enoyl-CoA hydratase family protein [Arenicella sp.]
MTINTSSLLIKKVAVLGAGVMGAQIAAHLVNCGVRVVLFDLAAKEGDKSSIAKNAIKGFRKQKPAPLATANLAMLIKPANYEDDLAELSNCDLVIEAIAERMEWKKDLYDRIEPFLPERVILASNTSGLSVNDLVTVLNERLKSRFVGMHFFNPPRYMHLLELIPCEHTADEVLHALEGFCVKDLGKGVVIAKDTPNFIGNRIGVFSLLAVMHYAEALNIPFEVVDQITAKPLGRPKSGTFRTADVVGLDTMSHVVNTMKQQLPDDPWVHVYEVPNYIQQMVEKGALGAKTRKGIYINKGKQVFSPAANDYVDSVNQIDDELVGIMKERDWSKRLQALKLASSDQARFTRLILLDLFHYCLCTLDEIANAARDVDFALRWGFGWEQGPFEIMQAIGVQNVVEELQTAMGAGELLAKAELPDWLTGLSNLHVDDGSFSPTSKQFVPLSPHPIYQRQIVRENVIAVDAYSLGKTIFEDDSVRMWDAGDDVAVLTVKTKMGTLGHEVLQGTMKACQLAENGHAGLVLWRPEAPFSVGANLKEAMGLYQSGHKEQVREYIADFQRATMALKYCQAPTVAAVQGFAFGGGCEFQLLSQRTVAAQESYIGLVEAGVGLLPAGSGTRELALRAARAADASLTGDLTAFLARPFETIALAKASSSALDAKQLGLLSDDDVVVPNAHELLYVAKQQVLAMSAAGTRPDNLDEKVRVAGRQGHANLMMKVVNMLEGHFISEHDYLIADRVATVLTGGDVEQDTLVPQEWLLKLERDLFFELMETEKTMDRIMHTLKTGKPLRN